MTGLSGKDIYTLVNRYIGVSGGYLGDFSYRTHYEFYREYCDLDIDPSAYGGTTRERFIQVLERSDPVTQAKILSGVLEKYPVGSSSLRTPEAYDQVRQMIARCVASPSVQSPELRITSEVVRRAIADAETLLQSSGATSAVDRVHTALHGYLKISCDDAGIAYVTDPSILDLFKLLRQHHPRLQSLGAHQGPIVQVLRSLGSVMDALNPARNRGSVAHPNDDLLDADEAMLFINAARTVLQYVDAKLA
jgi:Abortive infection C-terminus